MFPLLAAAGFLPSSTPAQEIPWGWQWPGQTEAHEPFAADFDGDGKADRCMVERQTGRWYILHSSGTDPQNIGWGWQWAGQTEAFTPLAADFDGDGKADRCMVERQTGRWYIIHSSGTDPQNIWWGWQWAGQTEDFIPFAADFDGDGKADRCMVNRKTGQWYIIHSSGTDPQNIWWGWQWPGQTEAFTPFAADFDGDGKADRCMVERQTGRWYIIHSSGTDAQNIWWGWSWLGQNENHIPFAADFDGDRKADRVLVERFAGLWHVLYSGNKPPSVKVGSPLEATTDSEVRLAGVVNDDGRPNPPGLTTLEWSQLAGPALAVIRNRSVAETTAVFPAEGVYTLQLSAFDGQHRVTESLIVSVKAGSIGTPLGPRVDAGPDTSAVLPGLADLKGRIVSTGPVNSSDINYKWSRKSGPGIVAFSPPGSPACKAWFSVEGEYVLTLTATSARGSHSDDVKVSVRRNVKPQVYAGPDRTVMAFQNWLQGSVKDDTLPFGTLTVRWKQISGPATVTFSNPNSSTTYVTFPKTGTYLFELAAHDGDLRNQDQVEIIVIPNGLTFPR